MVHNESKIPHSVDLPQGWRGAYYDSREEEGFKFVTAVYEHLSLGLKLIIVPDGSLSDAQSDGHTSHNIYSVYPLYTSLGIPSVFRREIRDFEWVAQSVVPELKPKDDEVPNLNDGPYEKYEDGRPRSMKGVQIWIEAEFDTDILPKDAVESMKTFKQYPLDYNPVVENIDSTMTAEIIADKEPDLLPEPFPVELRVSYDERRDYWYVGGDVSMGSRLAKRVKKYLDYESINLEPHGIGTKLATIYLQFQREEFPYDPKIERISVTDAGKEMMTWRLKYFARSKLD